VAFTGFSGVNWVSAEDAGPLVRGAIVKFSVFGADVPIIALSMTLETFYDSACLNGFEDAGCCYDLAKTEILKGGIHALYSPSDNL